MHSLAAYNQCRSIPNKNRLLCIFKIDKVWFKYDDHVCVM